MKKEILFILLLCLIPAVAGAGVPDEVEDFDDLVRLFASYLRLLVPFLIGLAVVVFLWGVLRYVTAGDDKQKLRDGARLMAYGIVAIFVMVAVWGLVWIIINFFGIDPDQRPFIPRWPTALTPS